MRQTASFISTYSADVFGVCSALFELGGMTVMHDASGCNSTYTTHDEPRWYDMDSMVYISGISEMEAIMGDDEKLIRDIAAAAAELHPKFIAIAGTPVPAMTGFDFEAVAAVIEQETGIPSFGFPTTGMNTYVHGASMALAGIAERFVREPEEAEKDASSGIGVNILGLTPLDFSVNGTDRSIALFLEKNGFNVISRWAMGSDLEELARAAIADVNLVVSAAGLGAAEVLKRRFGIPYVAGHPLGGKLGGLLNEALRSAAETGEDRVCRSSLPGQEIVLVGEGITSLALASAIELETGRGTKVLCATECGQGILRDKDRQTFDEDDIIPELQGAQVMIADPLYRPICPPGTKFAAAPSEAFSGRIYRREIIDPVSDLYKFLEEVL
ncbi:MAG: nitrogenase component 1 [Lachnospiraceae bacterium]|nr:nitrogenase component 1 [Lachnospiraceae bacterium]